MSPKVWQSSRVAVVLVLLFAIPAGPVADSTSGVGRGFSPANGALPGLSEVEGSPADQPTPAPDLDRALRANDLARARALVPVSWAASEQLFVSYLERAFITPDVIGTQPDARTLAGRWAEVHFRIVEYDFARSVVLALETADPAKRQQLVAVVRDYFSALEDLRATYRPSGQASNGTAAAAERRRRLAPRFLEVADRFRELSCPRGELWTLRSMINLGGASMPTPTERADKLADQLGDELSLVAKRPSTNATVATAERLGLPHRQVTALTELGRAAADATDQARLEQAAKYLERARVVSRSIPAIEGVNYWMFCEAAPRSATQILPALWSVYEKLKRPADAEPLLAEALEISRPFGEAATTATVSAFAVLARLLGREVGDRLLQESQAVGPKAVIVTLLRMGDTTGPRFAMFERAFAQGMTRAASADPHERALALEWYNRQALSWLASANLKAERTPDTAVPFFTPVYHQVRDLCVLSDELELTADALTLEGEMQARFGDPAMASETYRLAIDLAERAGNQLKVAQIANRAADPFAGRPSNEARVAYAVTAADAARKADNLLELTKALEASSRTVEDWRQALAAAVRYTEQSGDATFELRCLASLAFAHAGAGDYQAAIDVYLRIIGHPGIKTSPTVLSQPRLSAYQRLVDVYTTIGEPALARQAADQVRQMLETTVLESARPAAARQIGEAYRVLGETASKLGEPTAAIEYWGKALAKLSETAQDNSTQLSRLQTLEARGTLYALLGDFEASQSDWQDVLPLIEPTRRNYSGFSDIGHMVAWKTAVAWTNAIAGSLDQALSLAREAIAELQGDTSGLWAGRWYNNQSAEERLLEILLAARHPEEAIPMFEALLRAPLINRSREILLLDLLARAHLAAKQPDQARSVLIAAIEQNRSRPADWDGGGRSGPLLALGMVELATGRDAEAAERLLAARDAVNRYDGEQIWQIERALGLALARTGDSSRAIEHYDAALATLESIPERLRPEEYRLRYGSDRSLVYEEFAGLLAGNAVSSGREIDSEQAFQAVERKRTQMLWSLLATGWSRMPAGALPDQVRRSLEMETRLSAKQAILRGQFTERSEQRNAPLIAKLQSDLAQIQTDHARLLTSMAQGQYRYAAPTTLAASLAGPVKAALGASRVLVEYLVTDDRSYAFVVSTSGVKVVPLAVGRASLRQQVQRLLAPFRQLRSGAVDLARLDYDTHAAYALYRAIFAPVQPFLGRASDIVIVPDDLLNVLPFDALVEKEPGGATRGQVLHAELADQAFLLRRYAISYLFSSAQLLSSAGAAGPPQAPKRLFAMANPTGGRAQPDPAHDDPLKRQLRSGAFDAYFEPLPGADAEVRQIARNFAPGSSTIVTGGLATEAAYRSHAGEASVVHFATHAMASDSQPLYSTLILASDAKAGDDGFLQAYEVLRTPLRADLVVLSGCETALGSEDWGQGLVGLVAAFEQAGARSVLATLWSIDESTSDVMAAFYRAMSQGSTPAAALRQAKLQLMQRRMPLGNVEISLAHPFFWAPFKLMGAPSR